MIELISKKAAEGPLVNFLDLLTKTGYVRAGMVKKLLLYTFLLDFVEYMHAFIDERDYNIIEKMLVKLFSGTNCLLPYPVFCTRRLKLGLADYMRNPMFRITEDDTVGDFGNGNDRRITELKEIRTA